jgi:putative LysE/RhtB family amino acid efflux pump
VTGLVLAGYGLGLVLAAQVGPVTLLIVRSVLRGGRAVLVGLAMAAAVALVDALYALVGLAGLARAADGGRVQLVLGLASGAILVLIGARTLWRGLTARIGLEVGADVVAPRAAFLTAIAATALNPLTVALWTVSFPAAAPAGATGSIARTAAVLAGVCLGTLTWYCGFALLIAAVRRRAGPRVLRAVDVVSGAALVGFGGLLAERAVRER